MVYSIDHAHQKILNFSRMFNLIIFVKTNWFSEICSIFVFWVCACVCVCVYVCVCVFGFKRLNTIYFFLEKQERHNMVKNCEMLW